MPGPRRTLDEYVADRIRQLSDLGGVIGEVRTSEADGDALLMGTVNFGEAAEGTLFVYEHLRMESGRPTRFKYSYQANAGDDLLFRYDRDPVVHPEMPEHKHVSGTDRRFDSGRVTLHDVATELWDVLAERRDTVH